MFYVEGMNVIVATPGEGVNDAVRRAGTAERRTGSAYDFEPAYEEQVERVEVVVGPATIDGVAQAKSVHPTRHLVVHEALELRRTTAVVHVSYRDAGQAQQRVWHRARRAVEGLLLGDNPDRSDGFGRINRQTLGRYHQLFKSLAF